MTTQSDLNVNSRKRTIERIKALLSKTTANGCSEAEALAAIAKAHELMDAHDVHEADITFGGEQVVQAKGEYTKVNYIPGWLAVQVAKYCNCKVWRNKRTNGQDIVFLGLESDALLAQWMLNTLVDYVKRGAKTFIKSVEILGLDTRTKNLHRKSFERGCISRINERLKELTSEASHATVANGHGAQASLVVVKGALVDKAFADLNLRLTNGRRTRHAANGDAFSAGREAGNGATFGRPVNGGNNPRAIAHFA